MTISQDDRLIRIATPLGENTFIVLSFKAVESLSKMFSFQAELASERSDITFDQLSGKNATVSLKSFDNTQRFFNGIFTSLSPAEVSQQDAYSKYYAVIRPAAWLLDHCRDCRIFQDKNVPDIIKQVLGRQSLGQKGVQAKIDFRLDLTGSYGPREYCVQYNETDLDFINRLCEDEGIYYFFEHSDGKHTLVFVDSPDKHKPYCAGAKETVTFQKTLGASLDREVITTLQQNKKLTTGAYAARDYNFTIPDTDLTVGQPAGSGAQGGQGECYEYPGGYEKADSRGQGLAKIRMQASDVQADSLQGQSTCRGFGAGFKFTLSEHPIQALNGQAYVFALVRHTASQEFTSGGADGDKYSNLFTCFPHKMPYRPLRGTPKPLIAGSQTAIVTGPQAEEIHTDEHGRIKVKFFWDRRSDEKGDGNMSCWMRVSQNWAGGRWGAMHIPRVGQEVIVNFLDGNPDRPIVTGRVYNGKNLPPYDLPARKTRSTIMSNSTKNGDGKANEIRFEDLKGEEEFYTHAAKNRNEVVENDMSTRVKANQSVKVEKNRSLTIASGNESIAVESGGRDVTVNSDEIHTNSADFRHIVSGGYTLKVNGDITIDATGMVKINGAKIILNS